MTAGENSLSPYVENDFVNGEVAKAMDRCNLCGKCVKSCDVIRLVHLKEKKPRRVIEKRLAYLRNGQRDEDTELLVMSCVQCDKCFLFCPEGLNPHIINYACKVKWKREGEMFPAAMGNRPQDPFSYHKLLATLTLSPSSLKLFQSVSADPIPTEEVLYLGCVSMLRADLIRTLADVMNLIGFKGVMLYGPDVCCGRPDQMAGDVQGAGDKLNEVADAFYRLGAKRVICWCSFCQDRLRNYLGKTRPLAFKLNSVWEFLAENIEKWRFKKRMDAIATYQDPCGLSLNRIFDEPRKIIKEIRGIEFREMDSIKEKTVCCSGNASRLLGMDLARALAERRVFDAVKTGAKMLVTTCIGCEERLSKFPTRRYDMEVVNLISLIGKGNGIYHENMWEKLKATKDIEYIIRSCRKTIEESGIHEDDLRRELPRYIG
jgi:Fe-S oxidoreductase